MTKGDLKVMRAMMGAFRRQYTTEEIVAAIHQEVRTYLGLPSNADEPAPPHADND
jgi:hypothetical protein